MLAASLQALIAERGLLAISSADQRAALLPTPDTEDRDHFDEDDDVGCDADERLGR